MRIVFVGTTGSGKSTAARQFAAQSGLPLIELDSLYWGPNWTPVDKKEFERRVEEHIRAETWIIDGNYRAVRDRIWSRATHLVWLELPAAIIFAQLFRRTLWRAMTREPLWAGNRESLRRTFLNQESILVWFFKSHWKTRKNYPEFLRRPDNAHLKVLRLRSSKEVREFLAGSIHFD